MRRAAGLLRDGLVGALRAMETPSGKMHREKCIAKIRTGGARKKSA
jgi:hypothetical protein